MCATTQSRPAISTGPRRTTSSRTVASAQTSARLKLEAPCGWRVRRSRCGPGRPVQDYGRVGGGVWGRRQQSWVSWDLKNRAHPPNTTSEALPPAFCAPGPHFEKRRQNPVCARFELWALIVGSQRPLSNILLRRDCSRPQKLRFLRFTFRFLSLWWVDFTGRQAPKIPYVWSKILYYYPVVTLQAVLPDRSRK